MTMAHDLMTARLAPGGDSADRTTSWYAQGQSDALGDRLLMFDNTSAPSWEILRFRPALSRDSGFEAALRERVEQLASFDHPAFPIVRTIKELGHEDDLAVVTTYAAGACVSEALKKPRSAAFAAQLIRELVPALVALHEHAPGIAHGILTADRIVLTAEGQLLIRDHMVGSALDSLRLCPAELWTDFGILVPPTHAAVPTLDGRGDIAQLALVAAGMMTGRRVGPDEYPDKVGLLLDEIALRNGSYPWPQFQALRSWLERALQVHDRPFESAEEASEALAELGDSLDTGLIRQGKRVPRLIAPGPTDRSDKSRSTVPRPSTIGEEPDSETVTTRRVRPRFAGAIRWAALAAGVLALAEAAFIGRMLYESSRQSTAPAAATETVPQSLDARPRDVPANRAIDRSAAPLPQSQVVPATNVVQDVQEIPAAPDARETTPAINIGRRGGFRLSSAVQVHVLDGDRVLGSSGEGPIIAEAGRREFEFVNSAIGYRARRVVEIKPGQIVSVSVDIPKGNLNINATPWAAVWIDGNPVGETPLGNVAVTPGEHEIVFRHPELGERREKTIVRADVPTRVAVDLQR